MEKVEIFMYTTKGEGNWEEAAEEHKPPTQGAQHSYLFQAKLDRALRNLILVEGVPAYARGLELNVL